MNKECMKKTIDDLIVEIKRNGNTGTINVMVGVDAFKNIDKFGLIKSVKYGNKYWSGVYIKNKVNVQCMWRNK